MEGWLFNTMPDWNVLQLDLNMLNQIPLIIGSLFVWDGYFFLPLLLLLKPLLGLFFLPNNSLGNLEMQE